MAIKKVEDAFRNLPVTSILNAFAVMEDEQKTQFVNVFRAFLITDDVKLNPFAFEYYQVDGEEFLDDISSKIYNTPNLWWIIAEFNEITNPYESLEEGQTLKLLSPSLLYSIFDGIQLVGEL
jgi:hypothetical protein